MHFDPNLLDDIRARLPVSQVVGRKVKLTRQGREYSGLSPFKAEKTPSFTVNDQKGFYHCFATGAHGDIFKFVMETEGLSFKEAVESLAAEAGVVLPTQSNAQKNQFKKRDELLKICEQSCQFFESQLQSGGGSEARNYLRNRNLEETDYRQFRVGYAPEGSNPLKAYLLQQGFSEAHMLDAGLLATSPKDKQRTYDRFRNRITFPITDLKNNVIGFGARALDKKQKAKYLNSPETELFHKSTVLYNGASARQAAFEKKQVIIVEGYMDVIRSALSGFPNTVAPMGTALTPQQLQLLWRFAHEPILCFDGDLAGVKAAIRAMETALPKLIPGHSLRFAFLPEGKDPDDLIAEQGEEAFAKIIGNAKPLIEVFWDHHIKQGRWDTPESKAQLEQEVYAALAAIEDRSIKTYYEQDIKNRIYQFWRKKDREKWQQDKAKSYSQNGVFKPNKFNNNQKGFGQKSFGQKPDNSRLLGSAMLQNNARSNPLLQRETLLVGCMLNHSWLIDNYFEEISRLVFKNNDLDQLRTAILEIYMLEMGNDTLDSGHFHHHLKEMGLGSTVQRITLILSKQPEPYLSTESSHSFVEQSWLQLIALQRKGTDFKEQQELARQRLAQNNTEENFERLNSLKNQSEPLEAGRQQVSEQKELDDDFLQNILARVQAKDTKKE